MRDITEIVHVDYPHEPGALYDCRACEAKCHCEPGGIECVWFGHTDAAMAECEKWKALDVEFKTDPRSPLHHDNRCENH